MFAARAATAAVLMGLFGTATSFGGTDALRVDAPLLTTLDQAAAPVESPDLRERSDPTLAVGRAFAFDPPTADRYTFRMRTTEFDAYLIVQDEHGRIIDETDKTGRFLFTDPTLVVAGTPGHCLLVIACSVDGERGAFELSVSRGEPEQRSIAEENAEALSRARFVVAERIRMRGPHHPSVVNARIQVATVHDGLGDPRAGLEELDAAMWIGDDPSPSARVIFARVMVWRGMLQWKARRLAESIASCDAARAILFGLPAESDVPFLALADLVASAVSRLRGDAALSSNLARRAIRAIDDSAVRRPSSLCLFLSLAAELEESAGEEGCARMHLERTLAILEEDLLPHQRKAHTVTIPAIAGRLGWVCMQLGDVRAAAGHFERALAGCQLGGPPGSAVEASTWIGLAMARDAMGDSASACDAFENALIRGGSGSPLSPGDQAQAFAHLAAFHYVRGDPLEAVQFALLAADQIEKIPRVPPSAVHGVFADSGAILQRAGQLDAARTCLESVLSAWDHGEAPWNDIAVHAARILALIEIESGDAESAGRLLGRARLALDQGLRDQTPRAAVELAQANLHLRLGDFESAIEQLGRVLDRMNLEKGAGSVELAPVLRTLAEAHFEAGQIEEAERYMRRALEALADRPPDRELANGLVVAAALDLKQGNASIAEGRGVQALAILDSIGEPGTLLRSIAESNVAVAEIALGKVGEARRRLERTVEIQRRLGERARANLASSLLQVVVARWTEGLGADAVPELREAVSIFDALPDRPSESLGHRLRSLAHLALELGEIQIADRYAARALRIAERLYGADDDRCCDAWFVRAIVDTRRRELASARHNLERASAAIDRAPVGLHPLRLPVTFQLAGVCAQQGDRSRALEVLTKGLELHDATLGTTTIEAVNLRTGVSALLLDLGETDTSMKQMAYNEQLRRRWAAQLAARFITEEEVLERVLELGQTSAHDQLFVASAGDPTRAYECLLHWKGLASRIIRDQRRAAHDAVDPTATRLRSRLEDVVRSIARAALDAGRGFSASDPRALDALVDERLAIERQLGEFEPTAPIPQARSWELVRDSIPDDSVVVDFAVQIVCPHDPLDAANVGKDATSAGRRGRTKNLVAWITRPDAPTPARVDLGPVRAVDRAISEYLDALIGTRGHAAVAEDDAPGRRLRELVWDPIEPLIGDAEWVVISPDGDLGALPFEVLQAEDGRFLIEHVGFVYCSSAAELPELTVRQATPVGDALVVGGLDYGAIVDSSTTDADAETAAGVVPRGEWRDLWRPLEASSEEVGCVMTRHDAVAPGNRRVELRGREATEQSLRIEMPRHAILHLATHAFFNPDGLPTPSEADEEVSDPLRALAHRIERFNPGLLSGLVCSGANGRAAGRADDDGLLTAEEIGWLDLRACDLVVLSACDTGLGRPRAGEGMMSLRRAFRVAGARTVISSLWSVPDQETAVLMDLVYRNLWQRGMARHEALRAAQLERIAKNRAKYGDARPRTWGAFVLEGCWY